MTIPPLNATTAPSVAPLLNRVNAMVVDESQDRWIVDGASRVAIHIGPSITITPPHYSDFHESGRGLANTSSATPDAQPSIPTSPVQPLNTGPKSISSIFSRGVQCPPTSPQQLEPCLQVDCDAPTSTSVHHSSPQHKSPRDHSLPDPSNLPPPSPSFHTTNWRRQHRHLQSILRSNRPRQQRPPPRFTRYNPPRNSTHTQERMQAKISPEEAALFIWIQDKLKADHKVAFEQGELTDRAIAWRAKYLLRHPTDLARYLRRSK